MTDLTTALYEMLMSWTQPKFNSTENDRITILLRAVARSGENHGGGFLWIKFHVPCHAPRLGYAKQQVQFPGCFGKVLTNRMQHCIVSINAALAFRNMTTTAVDVVR